MPVFSTLHGLRFALLVVGILVSLQAQAGAQDISLNVDPSSVTSGEAVCPGTSVSFYCFAENVVFLRWLINGEEIKTYISQDDAPLRQHIEGRTLILNDSTLATLGLRNLTSTLVGAVGTGFQNGDRIECRDDSGPSRTLNFILISAPPAPTGYRNNVTRSDLLNFIFTWDASFNAANYVSEYRLMASDSSVECQESCSSEGPCQCSGFRDGVSANINVSAVSCGDLEGPAVMVSITPQALMENITCRGLPVYDYSGDLIMLQIAWNRAQNPPEIAPGVSQNVMSYSVSVNDDSSNITTTDACQSEECLFLYSMPSIPTDSTVTVAAFNIVGGGTKSTCSLPSMNIEQVNKIFSLSLSTTDPNNRTVECIRIYQGTGLFRCEFCLELDQRTCYNLSDNNLANPALNLLEDGSYAYYATAYINDMPVASIFDNFSTSCQPGELGAIDVNQTDPRCNSNSASIQNGYICYSGTVAGSLATYMCDDGYVLSGSEQRMCRRDGRWSERMPSCEEAPQTQYVWTIVLYTLTAVLMITSAIMASIRPLLIKIFISKPRPVWWCSLIWEGILLPIVLILWGVFFNNTVGYSQRVSLGFSFVLSILLVIGSLVITVAIIVYNRLRSQRKSLPREKSPDQPDDHMDDNYKEAP